MLNSRVINNVSHISFSMGLTSPCIFTFDKNTTTLQHKNYENRHNKYLNKDLQKDRGSTFRLIVLKNIFCYELLQL